MTARLLPGGHSTTTSLLPDGARLLPSGCLSVCCTATVRILPVCYSPVALLLPECYLPVAFCADFVEIFPKILVNQEKFVSL